MLNKQEEFFILLKQNRNTILTKFNGTNIKYHFPVIKYPDVRWFNVCPFSDEVLDYSLTSNPGIHPAITPRIVRYNSMGKAFYVCVSAYGRDIMVKSFKKDKSLRHLVESRLLPILVENNEDDE